MRLIFTVVAAMLLAQCASHEDRRFRVGDSPNALVIVGVAEAAANTSAQYSLLWRRLDSSGEFSELHGRSAFEPETNTRGSIRVRGIPGEFFAFEVEPGVYALDSAFAVIRDNRINYIADGLVTGPDRPAFEVRAGEAVYLGIWQVDLDDVRAVARPWRVEESDLRAMLAREEVAVVGHVRVRETQTRSVPCAPRRRSNLSQRQIC